MFSFSKHQSCHYERSEVISFLIALSISFLSLIHSTQAQTPAWTKLISNGNTLSAPTERFGHTAIYDSANNLMTIFGGFSEVHSVYLNDTWVLNTANGVGGTPVWTQLSPNPDPTYGLVSARYNQTAVYDAINNQMIIFGGASTSLLLFKDVWVLSTANGLGTSAWTQLFPTGSNSTLAREGHTAVYDNTNNRMTIFGGEDSGGYLNDVWVLSTANGIGGTPAWTQLSPTPDPVYGLPTTRAYHTAIYDVANNRMTIFGGVGGGYLNDVWVLSTANGLGGTPAWTQLNPTPDPVYGFPTGRFAHTAIYDSANNRMTIFGGQNINFDNMNDVWVLSNANGLDSTTSAWTQLSPTGSAPTTRYAHTAVYDATNHLMTIFGGSPNLSLSGLNDVWVLSNADTVPVELSSFEAIKE